MNDDANDNINIDSRKKIFEDIMKKEINWLHEIKFKFVKKKEWESNIIGKNFVYYFNSIYRDISIDIDYHPKQKSYREDISICINNNNDSIMLEKLMQQRGLYNIANKFENKEDFPTKEFVTEFFKTLKEIFTVHARDIIEGENWEPTPTDWGNLR